MFYAVIKGKNPGIYKNENEALAQIEGEKCENMQEFPTLFGARSFLFDDAIEETVSPGGYAFYPSAGSLNTKKCYWVVWSKVRPGIYMIKEEVVSLQIRGYRTCVRCTRTIEEAEEILAKWDKERGTDSHVIKVSVSEVQRAPEPQKAETEKTETEEEEMEKAKKEMEKKNKAKKAKANKAKANKAKANKAKANKAKTNKAKTKKAKTKKGQVKTEKPVQDIFEHENARGEKCAVAYTDGSYRNYICGWGVVFSVGGEYIELFGSFTEPPEQNLCSVASEIKAAKEAICLAISHGAESLDIYYDFVGVEDYADNCTQDQLSGPTKEYHDFVAAARRHLRISFHKVQGHSGNAGNNRADKLAGKAIENRVT